MKRKLSLIAALFQMLLAVTLFSSCDDSEGLTINLMMDLNVTSDTSGNHTYITAEPLFSISPSDVSMKVDKIEYYLDDALCKTVTANPYTLEYKSDKILTGRHKIHAVATIIRKDNTSFELESTKEFDINSVESKEADIWFDYNFTSTGDTFYISADVNKKRSPNVDIISMSVDWDGNKIGETFSAPFRIEKIITEPTGSKHEIKATVKYTQDGVESTRTFEIPMYEIVGSDLYEVTSFILKSSTKEYKNGEYLEAIAHVYPSQFPDYHLYIYIDDIEIANVTTWSNFQDNKYELKYLLNNLKPGKHILKYRFDYSSSGNDIMGFPVEEEITIIE